MHEAHEAELLEEVPQHMRGRIVAHLLQDVLSMPGVFEDLDAGGSTVGLLCSTCRVCSGCWADEVTSSATRPVGVLWPHQALAVRGEPNLT